MRNLKKVLALVLALVMAMSLVTIANAASFSDADDIQYTEAVDVLTALGVIEGVGNNTFNPSGNVTRAQMAKMITIISLGDVDPSAFLGTTTDLTDIDGHWAEAYIKYCYSQGIIAGKGNGIFDPNANVTSAEAAKMLLVAIGYNSDVQGYEGSQWAINVIRDAQTSKFYEDLSVPSNQALTRDQAAQLIYNAVQADLIIKTSSVNREDGTITDIYEPDDNNDLLSETFGAKTFVGTFVGNYDYKEMGSPAKGEIVVYGKLDTENTGDSPASFPYDFDLANIGEEVKVIFKDGNGGTANDPDKKDTIYGVFNTGSTTVYTTTKGDLQDAGATNLAKGKIKFGDTTYEVAALAAGADAIVTNYGVASVSANTIGGGTTGCTAAQFASYINNNVLGSGLRVASADTIKFVCNEDGKIERAYVIACDFDVVTGVTSDKISLYFYGSLDVADHTIYEGIAKDDIVMLTKLYDANNADATFVVEKAELMSGTVSKYYNSTKVAVDGVDVSADVNAAPITDGNGNTNYDQTTFSNSALGYEYEFVMYGSRYVAAKAINAADKDYAIVLAANDGDNINGQSVKLLLADGTTKTFAISEESDVGNRALTSYYDDTVPATDLKETDSVGYNMLVSYNIDNDGKVDMTELTTSTGNKGSYDKDTKSITTVAGTSYLTTADAVAFVYYNGEWKAYNANSLSDITGTTMDIQYKLDTNGKAVVFAIQANAAVGVTTSDYNYLYITTDARAYLDENDDKYTEVTGVDETGAEVTIVLENDKTGDVKLKKGNFIQYKLGTNDLVVLSDIKVASVADRVDEYDASRNLLVLENGGTLPVAKDVVILGVNTADVKASTTNTIPAADPVNTTYNNVVYMTDTVDGVANTVIAVFVDVNKNIKVNTPDLTGATNTDELQDVLNGGTDASFDASGLTAADSVTVPAGTTLTVTDLPASDTNKLTVNLAKGAAVVMGNATYTAADAAGSVEASDTAVKLDDVTITGSADLSAVTTTFDTVTVAKDASLKVDANTNAKLPAGTLTVAAGGTLKSVDTSSTATNGEEVIFVGTTADARIQTAADTVVAVTFDDDGTDHKMVITGDVTIPTGKTWWSMFDSGTDAEGIDMTLAGGTLTVNGTLNLSSANSTGSSLTVAEGAKVVVNGAVSVAAKAALTVNGSFTGAGSATLKVTQGAAITGLTDVDSGSTTTYTWDSTNSKWTSDT